MSRLRRRGDRGGESGGIVSPVPPPKHPLQAQTAGEPVVIVGAGEQGEIAYEYLTYDSPHTVVGFAVEPEFKDADAFCGLPLVSTEELTARFDPAQIRALVAVSSTHLNQVRARLFKLVKDAGYTCVSYVSSRAFVWHNVAIGENVFVFEDNVLQHRVRLGDNVILWSGNHLGHQTAIGADTFVASHAVISGFCDIGRSAYLGVNCSIANNLSLGAECVIGAGAVVVRDTEPRNVYVGNPARATGRDSYATFGVPGF
jgi:sugar O-acyltransferase (sialic acid O-acetyltransferase NeuD family)